jgi:MoxR-like ATPase
MRLSLGYPGRAAELEILDTHGATAVLTALQPVVTADEIVAMADAVKTVHLAPALKSYLVDIAEASRSHQGLALGLSPRATLQLARATRSRAAANGRQFATPDDVKAVASAVLTHRVVVRPDAASRGLTADDAVREVLASVPVPTGR